MPQQHQRERGRPQPIQGWDFLTRRYGPLDTHCFILESGWKRDPNPFKKNDSEFVTDHHGIANLQQNVFTFQLRRQLRTGKVEQTFLFLSSVFLGGTRVRVCLTQPG